MSRRSKSLQPPSDHGSNHDDTHSSDSFDKSTGHHGREDALVQLNVGGKKFDTTEATLGSRGPNFLTSLVTSPLPSIRDSHGRFFIDRSSAIFEVLLEYLRTRILRIPPNILPEVRLLRAGLLCLYLFSFLNYHTASHISFDHTSDSHIVLRSKAVEAEADFYGILLPHQSQVLNKVRSESIFRHDELFSICSLLRRLNLTLLWTYS